MPVTALLGAGIAAPIIGGVMGQQAAAGNLANAQNSYQNAYSQFAGINAPTVASQQLALQGPTVAGTLAPQSINAAQNQVNTNAMAGIQTDPRLAQAQMNALQTMAQMGQQGLTATDLAALNSAQRQVAGQNQANQQSIIQSLAQRGAAGGGLELATRLQAAQGAEDQAGQNTNSLMSQAQQRMLNATAQAGQLGGQIQAQQFGQQATQAQAANAIAAFNAQQAAAAQGANVTAANQAQAANLANAQNISNADVATQNAQQQYNQGLIQQNYNNQMGLAGARAGSLVGLGNMYQNQAGQQGAMYSGIGAGVGQGAMGAATMMNNNNNANALQNAFGNPTATVAGNTAAMNNSIFGNGSTGTGTTGIGGTSGTAFNLGPGEP